MKRAGLLLKPFGDYFLFGNVFDALAVVQFAVDDHRIPRQMLLVRHGLEAELTRAVYYELAELALAEDHEPPGIWSGGAFFPLGQPE